MVTTCDPSLQAAAMQRLQVPVREMNQRGSMKDMLLSLPTARYSRPRPGAWCLATPEEMFPPRAPRKVEVWDRSILPTAKELEEQAYFNKGFVPDTELLNDDTQVNKQNDSDTRHPQAQSSIHMAPKTTNGTREPKAFNVGGTSRNMNSIDGPTAGPRQSSSRKKRNKRKKAPAQWQPHESPDNSGLITSGKQIGDHKERVEVEKEEFALTPTLVTMDEDQYPLLIDVIKKKVHEYRMQDAFHFALHINLKIVDDHRNDRWGVNAKLLVLFENYSQEVHALCTQQFENGFPTGEIMVGYGNKLSTLAKMLAEKFPAGNALTSMETLEQYWMANDRVFNWAALPTELKENVIKFCVVPDQRSLKPYPRLFNYGLRPHRVPIPYLIQNNCDYPHPCELIDRFGEWGNLLETSFEVRAIALGRCFAGDFLSKGGLTVASNDYLDFYIRLKRLDEWSQLVEENSAPSDNIDDLGRTLKQVYRTFPKLYPELKRYGTFFHGIRTIDISFPLHEAFLFFNVTTGGLPYSHDRYLCMSDLKCDILEQIPNLKTIVYCMRTNKKHWKNSSTPGILFWHHIFPCPRTVYRILYERLVEVFAPYKDVTVKNFLDSGEQARYLALRSDSRKAFLAKSIIRKSKFTAEELMELYTDDGGGVELPPEERIEFDIARENTYPRLGLTEYFDKTRDEEPLFVPDEKLQRNERLYREFYPIVCRCPMPCRKAFSFEPHPN